MQVRKWMSFALCAVLIAGVLAGCGASSKSEGIMMNQSAPMAAAGTADYAVAETMAASEALTEEGMDSAQLPDNRKWIITVDISAETEDMDALLAAVQTQIDSLGGYVEDQWISNGSRYSTYRYRNANLTVRIPAENVDAFTEKVSGISNVVRSSKSLEDITLIYVDTESRLKALETEEARLLELMEQAENMSDLLEIEGRLTDVRYELESVASQLRSYDNKVNYATVYLNIEEVTEYTPVAEETLWQRISGGFVKSLKGVGEGIVDVAVWVLVNIPYLLVWGALLFVAVKLIRFLRKKHPPKKTSRKEKPEEKAEEKERPTEE